MPLIGAAAGLALVDADSFEVTADSTTGVVAYAVEPLEEFRVAATLTADVPEVPADEFVALGAASGTVTSQSAEADLSPLAEMYSVDDVPVFLLATANPWWRDVRSGLEGRDVDDLRGMLRTVGLPAGDSGKLTCAELRSFNDLLRYIAPLHPGSGCDTLLLSSFVWRRGSLVVDGDAVWRWSFDVGGPPPAGGAVAMVLEPATVALEFSSTAAFDGAQVMGTLTHVGFAPLDVPATVSGAGEVTVMVPAAWLSALAASTADAVEVHVEAVEPSIVGWVPSFALDSVEVGSRACVTFVDGRSVSATVVAVDGAFAAVEPVDPQLWPADATVGPGDGGCR